MVVVVVQNVGCAPLSLPTIIIRPSPVSQLSPLSDFDVGGHDYQQTFHRKNSKSVMNTSIPL